MKNLVFMVCTPQVIIFLHFIVLRVIEKLRWLNVEIVVKSDNDSIIYSKYKGMDILNGSSSIVFDELIKPVHFTKEKNTFTVYSCIWILKSEKTENPKPDQEKQDHHQLLADLSRLYEEMTDTDVVITAENKNFVAHRCILGPHSTILHNLFLDYDQKQKVGKVIIDMKFKPKLIEEMLRYFYTGKVNDLSENAAELLKITFQMGINSNLKSLCENVLVSRINVSNVSEMLKLAEMNNSDILRNKCISFLQECTRSMPGNLELPELRSNTGQQFSEIFENNIELVN